MIDIINNKSLTVGFWFGSNKPTEKDNDILTYTLYENTLAEQFEKFKLDYEEYKKRNPLPIIPYKNCLENEECYLIYESGNVIETTFLELSLLIKELKNCEEQIKKLDKDISNLEQEKINFIAETLNSFERQNVSITDIFNQNEIKTIEIIISKSKNYTDLQNKLLYYFKTIKNSLDKRGYHYKYLAYALTHSIYS
jgi:hypothetical protein